MHGAAAEGLGCCVGAVVHHIIKQWHRRRPVAPCNSTAGRVTTDDIQVKKWPANVLGLTLVGTSSACDEM